jgi:hypothetical protein
MVSITISNIVTKIVKTIYQICCSKPLIPKGVTLRHLNKFDEAIKDYDKAIEINPQYYEDWGN